jgi:RNA polymerase sigma-70 factor (ECF subfamily)
LLRIRDRSDTEAWRTFDALYRPMLERFARARGLSADDAEDIAQQCLTAVADKITEFSYELAKGRFKSWLRTLVNNRVRNLLRDRHEEQARPADFQSVQQRETAPDAAFDQIWMEEHLWHCLRELRAEVDETTYLAFQHYVIEQWPVERVATTLGLSSNNVYTIKWRLTERIAAKMSELLDGTE